MVAKRDRRPRIADGAKEIGQLTNLLEAHAPYLRTMGECLNGANPGSRIAHTVHVLEADDDSGHKERLARIVK